jgi:hypothetical protein
MGWGGGGSSHSFVLFSSLSHVFHPKLSFVIITPLPYPSHPNIQLYFHSTLPTSFSSLLYVQLLTLPFPPYFHFHPPSHPPILTLPFYPPSQPPILTHPFHPAPRHLTPSFRPFLHFYPPSHTLPPSFFPTSIYHPPSILLVTLRCHPPSHPRLPFCPPSCLHPCPNRCP